MDRLDLWALVLSPMTVWLLSIVIAATWEDGWLAMLSASFGIMVAFLGLHGLAVLWYVRNKGRARFRKVMMWLLLLSFLFGLGVLPSLYFGDAELILDGLYLTTAPGAFLALMVLWAVFFVLAFLMLAAACSAIWFLEKVLRVTVPPFVADLRRTTFGKEDGLLRRAEAWAVSFPRVLDPSSLRLEPQSMGAPAAKGRFVQALLWQLGLGLLIAVYVSLNPVLLQSMSFSQTFSLVSITSIAVPILVLPWSTLEALGARVDGVREDFYLHKGARTRMIQTMVALGTLFLIVRLAVQEIGVERILWNFAGYGLTLFIISGLVSFAYFNYFETRLIEELRRRLTERGL